MLFNVLQPKKYLIRNFSRVRSIVISIQSNKSFKFPVSYKGSVHGFKKHYGDKRLKITIYSLQDYKLPWSTRVL